MDRQLEVSFASPDKQVIIPVKLPDDSTFTVKRAIDESGIMQQFPEIDLAKMAVGVFSKVCELETVVGENDRVEIYRSLYQHPMDARRKRAINK
jgi:putative ubiquitin-RnfH superfamily antitoxin RatB of RatAB toxin-antitoxin module